MKTDVEPAAEERAAGGGGRGWTRRIVLWPIAACALWLAARLADADRVPVLAGLLVPVLAFTPYAALAVLASGAVAALLRRWTACAVAAGLLAAYGFAVLPRAVADGQEVTRGPVLRVLSANLRLGRAEPRALVRLVRELRPDVLSVQELTREAAAALRDAGLAKALPHRVAVPLPGATGSGLYARHPLRALPMAEIAKVGLAMPRARMRLPGGAVEVTAVHLARPLNPAGLAQWERGFSLLPVPDPRGPVKIFAGDFNATLDHAPLRAVLASGYRDAADAAGSGLVPTFRHAPLPPITIDHVLADARCEVLWFSVHDLPGSDHRALFAEVRLP